MQTGTGNRIEFWDSFGTPLKSKGKVRRYIDIGRLTKRPLAGTEKERQARPQTRAGARFAAPARIVRPVSSGVPCRGTPPPALDSKLGRDGGRRRCLSSACHEIHFEPRIGRRGEIRHLTTTSSRSRSPTTRITSVAVGYMGSRSTSRHDGGDDLG